MLLTLYVNPKDVLCLFFQFLLGVLAGFVGILAAGGITALADTRIENKDVVGFIALTASINIGLGILALLHKQGEWAYVRTENLSNRAIVAACYLGAFAGFIMFVAYAIYRYPSL